VAVRLGEAIDLYLGELARRGRRPATLDSYERLLNHFADDAKTDEVVELQLLDYERFLNRWVGASPSTLASKVSLVRGFSRFLWEREFVATDVAYPLRRPRRLPAEDLRVITLSSEDVRRILEATQDWQELLCVATAAYLGPRRKALALVRRADVDLRKRTIRFVEKGGKIVVKPMPDEYLAILRAAEENGVWSSASSSTRRTLTT
jgi:integrase